MVGVFLLCILPELNPSKLSITVEFGSNIETKTGYIAHTPKSSTTCTYKQHHLYSPFILVTPLMRNKIYG